MNRKRLKRAFEIALVVLIIGIGYGGYVKAHTFTLSGGVMKSEQIQPINRSVKVTGTADTDVVFTDIESGKTYVIGYITSGAGGAIKLERGKWYSVKGAGELTVKPVNVRIE